MKEQTYVLKNQESFNLVHTFECGQCFRWNKIAENEYIGIIKYGVLDVKKENNDVIISGMLDGDIEKIVKEYFDIDRDYNSIKKQLSKIDDNMKTSITYGEGIRILKQDVWEAIISFIISANNNIPRIKKIIQKISEKYGKKIEWNGVAYFLFPTPEELSKAEIKDLRETGMGFRDIRVYNTTRMIQNNPKILEFNEKDDTEFVREELIKLDGVGEKVADCVMLFSMRKFDVFPVDVWVRRVMNDLYIKNENEEKVNKKELRNLAKNKFGNLAGIAQQYLFYWKREA